jgi:hypothetical protein
VGGSFSVAPHFSGTTFARTRAFSFSIRFSAPLSSLCPLAYWKSLHTIRDGIRPNATARFFIESLGAYQRYCPKCLSETDYYSLTWRFLAVTGCSVHQCRLLERCGHCGNFIPLFTTCTRLGICSLCGEDLRSCPTLTLSVQEMDNVQRCTTDIEYLLSPQGSEEDKDAAIKIGLKYKRFGRQSKLIVSRSLKR